MQVERFKFKHLAIIAHWLKERELNPHLIDELPDVGFVVSEGEEIIAAGFIRQTEGDYALVDSYITNKNSPPVQRDQALDLITKELINISKSLGFKTLVATSIDQNTIDRSLRHGFKQLPHAVIALKLT